jgi:hypothetical protein
MGAGYFRACQHGSRRQFFDASELRREPALVPATSWIAGQSENAWIQDSRGCSRVEIHGLGVFARDARLPERLRTPELLLLGSCCRAGPMMAIEAGCIMAIVMDTGRRTAGAMAIGGMRGVIRNADGHRDGPGAPAR